MYIYVYRVYLYWRGGLRGDKIKICLLFFRFEFEKYCLENVIECKNNCKD